MTEMILFPWGGWDVSAEQGDPEPRKDPELKQTDASPTPQQEDEEPKDHGCPYRGRKENE
jgi:hypothetical protein